MAKKKKRRDPEVVAPRATSQVRSGLVAGVLLAACAGVLVVATREPSPSATTSTASAPIVPSAPSIAPVSPSLEASASSAPAPSPAPPSRADVLDHFHEALRDLQAHARSD